MTRLLQIGGLLLVAHAQLVDLDDRPALSCLQHHATHRPRQRLLEDRPSNFRSKQSPGKSKKGYSDYDSGWDVFSFDGDEEDCGLMEGAPDFIRFSLSPSDETFLQLDLTVLQHRRKVPILVTAMSLDGSYSDEDGFDQIRAMPLEDTENTLLYLQLSEDGQGVDIYKPGLDIRTYDMQSMRALKEGLGDGWLGSLERLSCSSRVTRTRQGKSSKKEAEFALNITKTAAANATANATAKATANASANATSNVTKEKVEPIVVEAEKLIWAGFFVAASTAQDAANYRILRARSFPSNLDLSVEYLLGDMPPLKVGFSVVLLPETVMAPRASDDRLLFFTSDFKDLGYREASAGEAPSHEVDRDNAVIWRYNLEALPENQIRVYVDPSVPPRWREWFRQGIEAWNAAYPFHDRRAVRGILPGDKDWPKDYDISDARFSTISWDLSDDVVSMGIAKVDPRSGQIMKSDIMMSSGWVKAWLEDLDELAPGLTHGIVPQGPSARPLGLLQQGSKVNTGIRVERGRSGAVRSRRSPGAAGTLNATELEELLGAGLKSVVMHETGHILGLRHNFKGSLGISLECLKDKNCTGQNGLSASVMDYVPTNIPDVDHPEKVDVFTPVIGGYDKLAIAFGYSPIKDVFPPRVAPELQQILKSAEGFEVCYDDGEFGEDPKCMAYDMSEEPITYFEQEVERLIAANKKLLEMSVAPGEPYRLYGEAVASMIDRTKSIGEKLVNWLGGIEDHFLHRGENWFSARPVDPLQQQRALALLMRILRPSENGLTPPQENFPYLVEGEAADEVTSVDISNLVHQMTGDLLKQLLSPQRILQIYRQQLLSQEPEVFSLDDMLNQLLVNGLDPGLQSAGARKPLSPEEMDLQLMLVTELKEVYLKTSARSETDMELGEERWSKHPGRSKSRKVQMEFVEDLPSLPEPIGAKLLYYLQRARQKTMDVLETVPSAKVDEWHHCAMLGGQCLCDGLVRLAMGADNATLAVSSVKPANTAINCLEGSFQVEANRSGDPPRAMRWCECLTTQSVEEGQVRSHVQLLLREFADVFCQDFETCNSPRVRLFETPGSVTPSEKVEDEAGEASSWKKYVLMGGGLVLLVVATLAVTMCVRRPQWP